MVRPHLGKCCTYQLLKSPILVDSQVTFTRFKWLDWENQKRCVAASLNPSGLSLSWKSLHIPTQLNQISTIFNFFQDPKNLRYHTYIPTFSSDTRLVLTSRCQIINDESHENTRNLGLKNSDIFSGTTASQGVLMTIFSPDNFSFRPLTVGFSGLTSTSCPLTQG